MKILVCSWGNICEPDLELSLKSMGHEVVSLRVKIKNNDYDTDYLKILSDKLMNNSYDCVFSINYIPIISKVCKVHQIKYISWTVDSPLFQLNSETITNNCNYIFIFDRCLYEKYKDKFPEQIFYMPLGTNVQFWDSIKLTQGDKERFAIDVSFVGSLYEDKHFYNKVDIPAYLRGYFDGIIEAQTNVYGHNFLNDVISDEAIKEFSKCADWNSLGKDYNVSDREIVISEFIGKKCAEIERYRFVDKLAKNFKFDLYTLSNTDDMPYLNNRGPADSRIDMPKIFKCSKININMTIKTIESGIPLRIYDIMGNGGFVMTNYQSELYEYFVPNEDLVVYESLDDLIAKTSYYLQHEEERKRIADNGYRKVKTLYTYEKRLEQIIEIAWQDRSKCYGSGCIKYQIEYRSLISIINQLNITKILDVGMFLNSQSEAVKQGDFSLNHGHILDGVKFINSIDDDEKETIYKKIFNLKNMPSEYYDLVLMVEMFQYLKDDEIIYLMKRFSQLSKIIIADYKDIYFVYLNDIEEFKLEKLIVGDCELLLITIN